MTASLKPADLVTFYPNDRGYDDVGIVLHLTDEALDEYNTVWVKVFYFGLGLTYSLPLDQLGISYFRLEEQFEKDIGPF